MNRYAVHASARFVVEGAASPEQALEWLAADTNIDLRVASVGHLQRVVLVDDSDDAEDLQQPGEDAFLGAHGTVPLLARWSPEAWPARACADSQASASILTLPSPDGGRGGYHPTARITGLLDELRLEALMAKQATSAAHRDRAFTEIAHLAQQCTDLIEKLARQSARTPKGAAA